MARPWDEVESNPDFLELPEPEQIKVRQHYLAQAEANPDFQALPVTEREAVRARILPPPPGPSASEQIVASLKGMAAPAVEAAKTLGGQLRGAQKPLEDAAADPRAAAEAIGERVERGRKFEIPGAANIARRLDDAPDLIGENVAEALARRGIPGAAAAGVAAGIPSLAAGVLLRPPATVGELEDMAAVTAITGGLARSGATIPALSMEVGAIPNAIRRRMGLPAKVSGTVVDGAPVSAKDVTPAYQGPMPAPARLAAPEVPPAPLELTGPAAPLRLPPGTKPPQALIPLEQPIQGEGFQLVPPSMRRVYNPRLGEVDVYAEPGTPLAALERSLGLARPAAAPAAAPKPKRAPRATADAPLAPQMTDPTAAPKVTKKDLRELAGAKDVATNDLLLTKAIDAIKADQFSPKQLSDVIGRMNIEYQRAMKLAGPEGARTIRIQQALEAVGYRQTPPEASPREVPAPSASTVEPPAAPPAASVEAAPAAIDPYELDVQAVQKATGKKLYQMTKAEFEAAAPGRAAGLHEDAIMDAMIRGRNVPEAVLAEHPDLEKALYERMQQESLEAVAGPETPILDLVKRMGIDKDLAEKMGYLGDLGDDVPTRYLRKGGARLEHLAEQAAAAGDLPGNDVYALIEALKHEIRTGTRAHQQKAPEGYTPSELNRPGQEGAINPGAVKGGRKPGPATPTLDEINAMREKPVPTKSVLERITDAARAARESQVDYLAPVERLVKQAEAKRGKAFTSEENAYILGKLMPGTKGMIEGYITRLEDVVRPAARAGIEKDLDNYLDLIQFRKRYEDLVDRMSQHYASGDPDLMKEASAIGQRLADKRVNPLDLDLPKIQRGLDELQAKLGGKDFGWVEGQAEKVWKLNREILDLMHDSGVVSDGAYKAITDKGLNYTPVQVLEYIDAQNAGMPGISKLSNEYQDVFRRMQGTDKATRASLAATYDYIGRAIVTAERNKVGRAVVDMRMIPGMETVIEAVPAFAKLPAGKVPFYVYKNGQRMTYAVPEDVGRALDGLGAREVAFLHKFLGATANVFKLGATAANVEFAIPGNIFRDVFDSAILAKSGLRARSAKEAATLPLQAAQYAGDMLGALFHAIKKDDVYREALMSKAFYSTIQKSITPELFTVGLRKKSIERTAWEKVKGAIPALLNTLEETPKLATYQRGRRQGMSQTEAAYDARTFGGSPDFSARGRSSPDVNLLFMFYNGKMQGTARLVRALQENRPPAESALLFGALVGLPALSLYLWNSQFEDYSKLDKAERERNSILMLPGRYTNSQGKSIPKYLRLPKTDLQRVIGNSMEAVLDHYKGVAGRDGLQAMIDLATSFSPINLSIDRDNVMQSATSSVLSGLNPAIKVPAELAGNYDTFRQRDLEAPGQRELHPFARQKASTTETAKALGRAAARKGPDGRPTGGLSPIMIQHGVQGFTGGVGKQALDVSDAVMRALGKAPARPVSGAYDAASRMPIVRKMVGQFEPRAEAVDVALELKGDIKMDKATAKVETARAIQAYVKAKSPETKAQMLETLRQAARLDPEIVKQAQDAALRQFARNNISDAYAVFDSMSPKDRGEMLMRLAKREDGLALRAQLFNEMRRRKAAEE